jgi:hypothetical protein
MMGQSCFRKKKCTVTCAERNAYAVALQLKAMFSSFPKFFRDTVALSFVCDNYYPIID